MSILIVLVPLALLLGFCFVCIFVWAARHGQYDDLDSPSKRILLDKE